MVEEIIKNRVGRTPLIRAKKLEKKLGIKKIYLKLEGNNPSGHREDRLAYIIIRDAITRNKKTICMGTYGTIGGSLAYLSKFFDVNLIFYIPEKEEINRKHLLENEKVKIIHYGNTYEDCVEESRRIAKEKNWYDANFGFANSVMNMYALSYVAKEINKQLRDEVADTVFCQTFNGSSIAGLHLGFKDLWIDEDIDELPKLWAVGTDNGNAIIESFKQGKDELINLDPEKDVTLTEISRNMVNWNCLNGQDALNAIYDTFGGAIEVSDDELIDGYKEIKKAHNIHLTEINSYPVAGFIKAVKQGKIKNGNHIILLDDGNIDLDLRILDKNDLNISYKKFLEKLDEWLLEFTDPIEEMEDAVENAFEKGYVLGAFDHETLVGIAILSRTGFDTFFPKYHLSYIATKKSVKGRGIATQLLQEAIEVTRGDLSLHVETNNEKAIKLYEKMGLRKKYYRMIYSGGEEYEEEDEEDEST